MEKLYHVLEGVKVVEVAGFASAPMAGRILSDMGADVIKVEDPKGDEMRTFGAKVKVTYTKEENPCYQLENAGKRDICLNLKTPEGMAVLFDLLKNANVLISNLRYGALQRMGLDYETIKDKFPHLVYAHLSGYGLKGEDTNLPGFDTTAYWARGGAFMDAAFKNEGPCATTYGIGDHSAAAMLAMGILGGLYQQKSTGKGCRVLTSLYSTAIFANSLSMIPALNNYDPNHFPRERLLPVHPYGGIYMTKDGEGLAITFLVLPRMHIDFCKAIGHEEWIDDERFAGGAFRSPANIRIMTQNLIDLFKSQDYAYWEKLLSENNLPFARCNHFKDVFADQQAWDNGFLTEYTFASGAKCVLANTPVQFEENQPTPMLPAPEIGEHTVEILKELGYDQEKIDALLQAGTSN